WECARACSFESFVLVIASMVIAPMIDRISMRQLSQSSVPDRRLERKPGIPGKIDPGILGYFGDECIHHGPTHGFGIDRGEMRLGQDVAHHLGRPAGIDEVIDDEHTLAAPTADSDNAARHVLEHLELALSDVIVARNAD